MSHCQLFLLHLSFFNVFVKRWPLIEFVYSVQRFASPGLQGSSLFLHQSLLLRNEVLTWCLYHSLLILFFKNSLHLEFEHFLLLHVLNDIVHCNLHLFLDNVRWQLLFQVFAGVNCLNELIAPNLHLNEVVFNFIHSWNRLLSLEISWVCGNRVLHVIVCRKGMDDIFVAHRGLLCYSFVGPFVDENFEWAHYVEDSYRQPNTS